MLLTVTSTAPQATELGHLLHKHPAKAQSFNLAVGTAHVFYPEATDERCTVALLLEVDPISLTRGRSGARSHDYDTGGFSLAQYVNDRPYASSSMLAVALERVFRTAMAGRCDARPELPEHHLPLQIHVTAVPCPGGAAVAEQMFAPLGWTVEATPIPLDPTIAAWGDSRYIDLRLTGTMRLADALSHLYVLLPVLDTTKHSWMGPDEVDKPVRVGESWLATHPEREQITHRYLADHHSPTASAVARLAEVDDIIPEALDQAEPPSIPLARHRLDAVLAAIHDTGARTVVDLGCGEGMLLGALLADSSYEHLLGVDVSHRALGVAARRLHLDALPDNQRRRIDLIQSSVTYKDERVAGFDVAVLMEVVEHIDPPRLASLERMVLGLARPGTLIVTTPNALYNVRFESLPAGTMRHHDHRFEWTRAQFQAWARAAAETYGYTADFRAVGPQDDEVGSPTQMAVLHRHDNTHAVAADTCGVTA